MRAPLVDAMTPKKIARWPDDTMAQAWINAAFSRPMCGACGGPVFGLVLKSEQVCPTVHQEFRAWLSIGRMLK